MDLALLAAVVLVVAGGGVISYNRFVTQLAAIDATWAGIDTELQRRHDLVPRLVATVRAYATHEADVLERVVAARTRAVAAVPGEVTAEVQAAAEDELTQQLTSLLALREAHPELDADGAFRDLQRQLVETEDRIATARRLYNIEVAAYERRRGAVPSLVVARLFALPQRRPFMMRDPGAAHAPTTRN